MIVEDLFAINIARKSAHAIIHRDDVRIEAADQIIQRRQRCDLATGRNINVHAERSDRIFRMIFRIRVHSDVALVQMADDRVALLRWDHRSLSDQKRHTRPLRIVVLVGDVQHIGPDHIRDIDKNIRETIRVVLFIDICHVIPLLANSARIADIIYIKAQSLREVIEPIQAELIFHLPLSPFPKKMSLILWRASPRDACQAILSIARVGPRVNRKRRRSRRFFTVRIRFSPILLREKFSQSAISEKSSPAFSAHSPESLQQTTYKKVV